MAEGTRGLDIKKLEVQMRDQEKAVQRVSNRTDEIANKTDDLLKLMATIASQQSAMMQMMQSFGMNSGGSSVSSHDRDEQEPFNQPANQIPHQDPQQRPIHFGKLEFPPWRLYRCDHFFANETPENLKLRYNFNKVAQYKQLTLEEAEEKMKNRKKTADGDDDEGNASDRGAGDDDEEDGSSRKSKLRSGDDDEAPRGRDPDMEDEEEEKGDDLEHDEHFSDDDERLDVEEEREDLANEAVPPEIKDDENEEDTPASKGKRKLNSDDEEPCSNAPSSKKTKNDSSVEAKSSAAKDEQQHPSKGASKSSSDSKAAAAATGPVTGEEIKSFLMRNAPIKMQVLVDKFKDRLISKEEKDWFAGILRIISPDSKAATNPVTEEEIKSFLMQNTPVTTKALGDKFKDRLRSKEDKDSFVGIIKKIIKIQKINGSDCAVLKINESNCAWLGWDTGIDKHKL